MTSLLHLLPVSSMATVLSRALKLPGKKSHDLREYDPLTQADSDESEDDLVINIQHNGLQNGKGTQDRANEIDSDVEEISKRVQQRRVDNKQDGLAATSGLEPQLKATSSLVSYVRTTVFLLTVVISMIMVLVCAFLIPCPLSSQQNVWYVNTGYEPEVSPPMELFDVNKDGVPDILLLSVSPSTNTSLVALGQQPSISALSGINGSVLWKRNSHEYLRSIQCGRLVLKPQQHDTCLLTGTSKLLTLISASTGSTIWTLDRSHVHLETMAAPAVFLPDLDEDNTNDLLILTIGQNQPDLGFLLVSGLTGKPLGGIVKYNRMGEGKVIDPQAYYTSQGAIYILFGFGNIQVVALRDIYAQAKNRDSFPSVLQKKEPDWEKRRSLNLSELISVYSADVEFLQTIPVFGSNCSDLLVTTKEGLFVLRGQDLEQKWSIALKNIYSIPQPGYFNTDGNLDFFVQIQSSNDRKKIVVIDGSTGAILWEWEVLWHERDVNAMSLLTADGKSVFLFWGGRPAENTSVLDSKSEAHLNRHLYLLYPTYPGVVLDLFNITASIVATGGGIIELEKDVVLAIMTAEKGVDTEKLPRNLTVHKLGIKWALSKSQALSLEHVNMKPKVEDVKRILARLKFSAVPQRIL
ncbi:PREDICTED: protein FAM234B [Nanorana parkeri]|uniref:protein FAM234B n=1 Tax=Nanorana parkeri TaxID=125878 RepID=UPI00085428D7|nr:PREDICTED: protein FAM234B [Nanorana parkeri]